MKVLVLGSTGKTGFHVVTQLLNKNIHVKAIARNKTKFREFENNNNLEVVTASILEMENDNFKAILSDIDIIISCLGHNLTLKGIFGKPHYLVTEAIEKLFSFEDSFLLNKKIILMNTTACLNKDLNEEFSFGEKIVIGLLRLILPPQRDNERAIKLMKKKCNNSNKRIEWVAIRPDSLIDNDIVTETDVFESIQRSPIFNAGETSRINVANFMQRLVSDEELWDNWKFKMPVIYNI